MWEDPIVKDVHETRARILGRFGGDVHAYADYIRALEAEDRKRGVQYADLAPRRLRRSTAAVDLETDAA
jgi:hypothetical protein